MSENNKDLTTSQEKKVQKKDKQPGVFARIGKWFHELKVEAKKVVWPNKQTVVKNTVVVIIALIVLCALVTVLDVVFGGVRDLIARLV
ncbi:MAG: preprotein translocase subunit SecE [Clostridia bacterium]|jgi:preprotein translocase subunit SecE|nr:preprotein translocase subunit SecE [Clostridia bacterium]